MSYAQQRTLRMAMDDWDAERLLAARRELRSRVVAPLAAAGYGEAAVQVEEVAAIRYRGQSYAIEIPDAPLDDRARLNREFLERHRVLYGFATDEPWELVSVRIRVSAPRTNESIRELVRGEVRGGGRGEVRSATASPDAGPVPDRTLECTFGTVGPVATPRFSRASVTAGCTLAGPVIVEDAWSTVVVPPGATLTADEAGHLHIATGAST